jgi:hypothetical protein
VSSKGVVLRINPIGQQMHLVSLLRHAQLYARDQTDVYVLRRLGRCRESLHGVVICKRKHSNLPLGCSPDEIRG